jgi:hypothetical protein
VDDKASRASSRKRRSSRTFRRASSSFSANVRSTSKAKKKEAIECIDVFFTFAYDEYSLDDLCYV